LVIDSVFGAVLTMTISEIWWFIRRKL